MVCVLTDDAFAVNAADVPPLPTETEAGTETLPLLLASAIVVVAVAAALSVTVQFAVPGVATVVGVQERLLNCTAGACTVTVVATLAPE